MPDWDKGIDFLSNALIGLGAGVSRNGWAGLGEGAAMGLGMYTRAQQAQQAQAMQMLQFQQMEAYRKAQEEKLGLEADALRREQALQERFMNQFGGGGQGPQTAAPGPTAPPASSADFIQTMTPHVLAASQATGLDPRLIM